MGAVKAIVMAIEEFAEDMVRLTDEGVPKVAPNVAIQAFMTIAHINIHSRGGKAFWWADEVGGRPVLALLHDPKGAHDNPLSTAFTVELVVHVKGFESVESVDSFALEALGGRSLWHDDQGWR